MGRFGWVTRDEYRFPAGGSPAARVLARRLLLWRRRAPAGTPPKGARPAWAYPWLPADADAATRSRTPDP